PAAPRGSLSEHVHVQTAVVLALVRLFLRLVPRLAAAAIPVALARERVASRSPLAGPPGGERRLDERPPPRSGGGAAARHPPVQLRRVPPHSRDAGALLPLMRRAVTV